MPSLPGHLFLGRANIAGPVIGGYCALNFGPYTIAASQTDLVQCAIKLPFAFRLERISWAVRVTPTASGTLKFYSGATLGALTTNLLNVDAGGVGVGAVDIHVGAGTAASGYCLPLTEKDSSGTSLSVPTTDTLSDVAGVRTLAKDTFLAVAGTTDATVGGAIDVNVSFLGFIMGHPNVLTESD